MARRFAVIVSAAEATVKLALPLLDVKVPVGSYVAETVWLPAFRDNGVYTSHRLLAGEPVGHVMDVPETAVPASIVKLTVPVGTAVPDAGLTVAVKVTDVP